MFQIPNQTALDFLWLGKEATQSPEWIHYSRALHEYELMIVDDGILYIADEFGKYTVSKGEYILMAPCRHQYGWKPSRCTFHWLHFRLPDTESGQTSYLALPTQARIPDSSKIQVLLSQIYHNEQTCADLSQSSFLLSALLLELHNQLYLNRRVLQNKQSAEGFSLHNIDLCEKIKTYVHWNRSHGVKVREIASYLQYSPRHLSSVFSKVTGMHLKTYIDKQQMEAAKELLSGSPMSIAEIAYQLGFSDSHNFSRTFKRITGQTPKDYRYESGHATRTRFSDPGCR